MGSNLSDKDMMARGLGRAADSVMLRQAERIAELETLLRRIDAVIIWETTPLGRSFQDEIEAALKRQ